MERLQTEWLNAPMAELIIVLGAKAEALIPHVHHHPRVRWTLNETYTLGQTSSLQTGLAMMSPQSQGFFLLPVDFPFISTDIFRTLAQERHAASQCRIFIPTYCGRAGHPPLFDSTLKEEFLNLSPDQGLNLIARRHPSETHYVPVSDPGVIQTFNTPEEWTALLAQRIEHP